MNTWYQNKILWVIILVLAAGGLLLLRGGDSSDSALETDGAAEVREGEIAVTGAIACLPYRAPEPGQGCVKALKGSDGKVYALNSSAVKGIESAMSEGTKVKATGLFQPADASADESSVFLYDGVLVLSSLVRQ